MTHQPKLSLAPAPASHPHLLIALPEHRPASRDTITHRYHVSFALPDAIFIDRHELIDLWGHCQTGRVHWYLTPEKIDIERPVINATEPLNLRVSWSEGELDVPLHVRYLEPNAIGSETVMLFRRDDVKAGWDCKDLQDKSCLQIVQHAPLNIKLPTGQLSDRTLVELATPIVIWLGWTYLFTKIWSLSRRSRHIKTD